MKYTPDGYGEGCRFDAFCKTVLRNEARTHLRDLGRQRNREIEFSALSQQEMDKLCTVDEYPSNSFLFTAYGYKEQTVFECISKKYTGHLVLSERRI